MLPRARTLIGAVAALALSGLTAPAAPAAAPAANPWTAPAGAGAMHDDSAASDTTPLPGPGPGAIRTRNLPLGGPCPSVLIGGDGLPVAMCTGILDRRPVAYLLDPSTGGRLASLKLTGGGLFTGVYPYLDQADRLVVVDGSGALLRIAHERRSDGRWILRVAERTSLRPALATACDGGDCGGVVGLAPDWDGRVWFATDAGVAGFVDRAGTVQTLRLGEGEHVANSIATAPSGTAIATDHALYLLRASDGNGAPAITWRADYDRGPARKPGQLSRGTGSTPTFFGPTIGDEYLAIVDNAAPLERLLVFPTATATTTTIAATTPSEPTPATPTPICTQPILSAGSSGSENSPIGAGRAVVVASTYGYPYPAVPDSAGRSVPSAAPFRGGATRVDVREDGSGCDVTWTSRVRSAAVPKLSLADGLIYTVARRSLLGQDTPGLLDAYDLTTIDLQTGATRSARQVAATSAFDTMQLAGNVGAGGVFWQGTFLGLLRIAPGRN